MENESNIRYAMSVGTRLGIGLFLFIGVHLAISHAAAYIFNFSFSNYNLAYLFSYFTLYGLGFFLFLMANVKTRREKPVKENWKIGRLFICLAIAYGAGIICNLIYTIISFITGGSTLDLTGTAEAMTNMVSESPLIMFAMMVIVAPLVEELVFRKTIIDCAGRFGQKSVIVFSAVMFGLYHMNVQQFFYAFCIGLIFAYVYSRTGHIYYTMAMHSAINLLGFLVTLSLSHIYGAGAGISLYDIESILNPDISELLNLLTQVWPWLLLEYSVTAIAYGLLVVGIIFFIKRVKKVRFEKNASCQLKNVVPLFANAGIIAFMALALFMITFTLVVEGM